MFGLLRKLLICLFLLGSVIASYGQTPKAPIESPKKQTASSDESTKQPKQDAKQSTPAVKVAPATESDHKTKQVPEQDGNHPAPDWWLILVTGLLVIASGGLVYYARDTGRRQLRAYISMTGGEPVEVIEGSKHFGFAVHFKNAGQTPAYDVVSGARCTLTALPRTTPLPDVKLTERSTSTFGPGIESSLFPTFTLLTPEQKVSIQERKAAINIHGRIEYRDAFNGHHTTHFNMIYRMTNTGRYIVGNDKDVNEAN